MILSQAPTPSLKDYVNIAWFFVSMAGILSPLIIWAASEFRNRFGRTSLRYINTCIRKLHEAISKDGFAPDAVIGIGRSGGICAGLLAYRFSKTIPVIILNVEYRRKSQPSEGSATGFIREELVSELIDLPRGMSNVIVLGFDIISGGSMRSILDYLARHKATNVKSACLFYNDSASAKPDFFVKKVTRRVRAPWVDRAKWNSLGQVAGNHEARESNRAKPKSPTIRMFVVRHAETTKGSSCFLGRTDAELSGEGRSRARKLLRPLWEYRSIAGTWIYSSPQGRALETAKLLENELKVTTFPVEDPDLREVDWGIWEGMTRDEVADRYPQDYKKWRDDPASCHPANGEPISSVQERCKAFLKRLEANHSAASEVTVFVIGHKVWTRCLLAYLSGTPLAKYRKFDIDYCECNEVRFFDGNWNYIAKVGISR